MLVVDRVTGHLEDRQFKNFPDYIRSGDKLVVNNTRVLPARLTGTRAGGSGGRAEALLVKRLGDDPPRWEALVRPAKRVRVGETLVFSGGLTAKVVATAERGLRELEFPGAGGFHEALARAGAMPLPPYIKREVDAIDEARYQTVYADRPGSSAAPTAGLHFTREVLRAVQDQGATRVDVTLEVGLGTFQPICVDTVEEHRLHSERFHMSAESAERLTRPGRIVAVGTTSVRTLEHCASLGDFRETSGETDIFIYPGYQFRAVGALLTNFHLPQSTLLCLVDAFVGPRWRDLYDLALAEEYRFLSFGDAMLLPR